MINLHPLRCMKTLTHLADILLILDFFYVFESDNVISIAEAKNPITHVIRFFLDTPRRGMNMQNQNKTVQTTQGT